jgi:hypothetical protein
LVKADADDAVVMWRNDRQLPYRAGAPWTC